MISIYKPFMPEDVETEISEILYSGQLAYGKDGKNLKPNFQNIWDPNTLTTATYNQALLMVLSVLDLKPGDEIIASPVSCLASNQPFAVKGLKIIWADINPHSGMVEVESIKNQITGKIKAIFNNLSVVMPVNWMRFIKLEQSMAFLWWMIVLKLSVQRLKITKLEIQEQILLYSLSKR